MNTLVRNLRSCDPSRPYVFVSYSKTDGERVYPFIRRLQNLGCNIWIDKELNKMIGRNWQLGALTAMTNPNCRAILFMISENSLKSAPVFAELALSQKSPKVRRKHNRSAVRIIPVNADPAWAQSKTGLATWIGESVSLDSTPLTADDIACLKIGDILQMYVAEDSLNRLEEKGEIAQAILDDVLEPYGGGKITVASISDMETVLENIDDECFCIEEENEPLTVPDLAESKPAAVPEMHPEKLSISRETVRYPNGDVYEGELSDGLRSGYGRMVYASGDIYEGEYLNDMRHGSGTYRFANGNVYKGSFKNNLRDGYGVYKLRNGDCYEGEFRDDKRCGHGRFTFADGTVRECEWKDNKPV